MFRRCELLETGTLHRRELTPDHHEDSLHSAQPYEERGHLLSFIPNNPQHAINKALIENFMKQKVLKIQL